MDKMYDFSGWATKNDLKCSDGRTIRKGAFSDNDGTIVPLVWNHQHDNVGNVLGHALLENKESGVYAYCTFNASEEAKTAKILVQHGDVTALSIYANQLKQVGGDVLHGAIREVSLVLAGANPGAYIDSVMIHGYDSDEDAVIYTGEGLELYHADSEKKIEPNVNKESENDNKPKELDNNKNKEDEKKVETVNDVIDGMTEKQQKVLYGLISLAAQTADKVVEHNATNEEDKLMHKNIFEGDENTKELKHAEIQSAIADGKRYGSLKESFLQHGITDIDYLFPDNKDVNGGAPALMNTIPAGWVDVVMNGVHHTPFSRVKMAVADITMETARAKGYIKGKKKIDEQFALLKRIINPQTVYKKQTLDRDDVVDITDFDVIAWLKQEMRLKLNEELARAYLFGDGRAAGAEEKINENNIIPVAKDTTNNLYAISCPVVQETDEALGHAIIRTVVKGLDKYEGSGNTIAFMSADTVSDMLLIEDKMGHRLYKGMDDLALGMGVNKICKVPVSVVTENVLGVVLDLRDYNVGADRGGAVNMFDDFDIDYNAQKYLIETRCSGGLIKPHSALVLTVPDSEDTSIEEAA